MIEETNSLAVNVLLGSTERRGDWKVPARIDARVTLGHLQLDLRDADLGPDTTIDAVVTLGNLEILVPEDVVIDIDVDSIAANVDGGREPMAFGMPGVRRLRVTGKVRFASCEVIPVPRGLLA
jgi:hypothetical protein